MISVDKVSTRTMKTVSQSSRVKEVKHQKKKKKQEAQATPGDPGIQMTGKHRQEQTADVGQQGKKKGLTSVTECECASGKPITARTLWSLLYRRRSLFVSSGRRTLFRVVGLVRLRDAKPAWEACRSCRAS